MNPMGATFNRSGKPSVCFQCAERKVGCHGSCERYLREQAEKAKSPGKQKMRNAVFMENYKLEQKRRR